MATVDHVTVHEAGRFLLVQCKNGKTLHKTFKELGVTSKQWRRYGQSGKRLKVRAVVAAKIRLLASCVDTGNPHYQTLLKMVEIKHRGQK